MIKIDIQLWQDLLIRWPSGCIFGYGCIAEVRDLWLLGSMRSAKDRDVMNLVPSAAECSYAACFCEENVWKLCDHVRTTAPNELSKAFVVFVSNKKQVSF